LENYYDAVVVGAGPNGLCAAIRLAQAGLSVVVLESGETVGGSARSALLTLPGFVHDVGSAVHPLGVASPFLRGLSLEKSGLSWVHPQVPLAHPVDGNRAAILARGVQDTAAGLTTDRHAYERLIGPLFDNWEDLIREFLQPMLHIPERPFVVGRFGLRGSRSATALSRSWFKSDSARALFAGLAAHSFLPLEQIPSAAFGLVLALLAHAVGWPLPRGGSQAISNALVIILSELGGEVFTGYKVESLAQLPHARVVLLDLSPRSVLRLTGERLPAAYRSTLSRFRYGPGVFKIDYALDGPVPWSAKECTGAGTVHIGGTLEEIASSEREVANGQHPARPFVLLAQPTLFDPTRAPAGKHIAWAYCHVPAGSQVDMTQRIEAQIERFAPGFRDLALARHTANCVQLESGNANLVNGSIDGGATDLWQLLARPILSSVPYRIPLKGYYLCSASTPPGAGVHGMCGVHAAETALRDWFV
jgi:phytoene dehydrogenase-like protein